MLIFLDLKMIRKQSRKM